VYYGYRKEAVEQFIWQRGHKPIGTGGFGSVFKEECVESSRLGSARAVKYIKKPASSHIGGHIDYGRELEAIARSSKREYEPCFVQSEGWFETETDICIIMELVPLGSLQQYIAGGLPEVEAGLLVRQVLQGLQYMHGAGYAHRDLKPHARYLLSTT
jgi:serine/threonine protein kinase